MRTFRNLLFFLFGSFVLYYVAMKGAFVFDDYKVIVQNEFIRFLWPATYLWEYDPSRFLPNLTFAANFMWSGLSPWWYHFVNVMLHGVNAWLVFLLVLELGFFKDKQKTLLFSGAFCTAVLVLIHPIQTQSVSYIVQRSTLMEAMVFLIAVFAFIRSGRAQRTHTSLMWYCLSLIAAMAGAFCKPSMIALPFVLIFVQCCCMPSTSRLSLKDLLRVLPFFIVLVFVAWNLWVLKSGGVGYTAVSGITRQTLDISRIQYFSTQMNVIVFYIFILCCPFWQNLDYNFPISEHLMAFPTFISLIAVVALIYFAVRWWKRNRLVSFGILWFLVTLMPESSFFPLSDVIFEHRLYLPFMGFALILSGIIFSIPSMKARIAIIIILFGGLSGLTVSRNILWGDVERLLQDTIAKFPQKMRPIYNLESLYVLQGRYKEAEELLDRAFKVGENFPPTHFKKGILLLQKGDNQQAYRHFVIGSEARQPLIAAASAWHAGVLAEKMGRVKEAEKFYSLSIEKDPRHENAHIDFGNLYNKQGRYNEAKQMYASAIHIAPLNPNGHNGLATVLVLEGNVQQGIDVYKKALELLPDSDILRRNLAKTYLINKQYVDAGRAFVKMFEEDPQDIDALYYVALAHMYVGDKVKSDVAFHELVRLMRARGMEEQAQKIIDEFLTPEPVQE